MSKALTVLLLLFLQLIIAVPSSALVFSESVPPQQQALVVDDLIFLNQLSFAKSNNSLFHQFLKVPELTGNSVNSWLDTRIKILATDKDILEINPDPEEVPRNAVEQALQAHTESMKVMYNRGADLYEKAKAQRSPLEVGVSGVGIVSVRSPRVGIVEIGKGFFSLIGSERKLQSRTQRIFRIESMLHEARHSDGNGSTLSFHHSICPEGHDYEGLPACDVYDNGAYGVGQEFLQEFSKNCEDCSNSEKDILKMMMADNSIRLLSLNDKIRKLRLVDTAKALKASPKVIESMMPQPVIGDDRAEGFR